MKKIAVYGSLRDGMYNHRLLVNDGVEFVSKETISVPFKMIPYSSFPALIPDNKNNDILMEIYAVNDTVYHNVEILEGYPDFYDKAEITDSAGDTVEVYVIRDASGRLQQRYKAEDSIFDWNEYYNQHFAR